MNYYTLSFVPLRFSRLRFGEVFLDDRGGSNMAYEKDAAREIMIAGLRSLRAIERD